MKKHLLLISSFLTFAGASKAQWVQQNSNFTADSRGINSITIQDDNTAWAVAYDGSGGQAKIQEYTKTSDGGLNWSMGTIVVPRPATFGIANISALNKDTAWAALFDENSADTTQGIYKTVDGGTTWTQLKKAAFGNGSFTNLVHFWDKNNGVAMGDPKGGYFEIYTTTDGGTNWARVANTNNVLSPIKSDEWGLTNSFTTFGNTIWLGTDYGRVLKSTDMGLTWTASSTPFNAATKKQISGLAFRDANNGIVGWYDSSVKKMKYAKTTDGGTTWTAVTSTGFNYYADFCWVPGTNMYVSVGADFQTPFKGTSMSTDDGATWKAIEDTTMVPQRTAVAFLKETLGYAGGFNSVNGGGMYKWSTKIVPFDIGVKENTVPKGTVVAYPNPVNDVVSVILTGFSGRNTEVTIYNVMGEKVYTHENTYATPNYTKHIDFSQMPGGVYIISVNDGTYTYTQRVVKQ